MSYVLCTDLRKVDKWHRLRNHSWETHASSPFGKKMSRNISSKRFCRRTIEILIMIEQVKSWLISDLHKKGNLHIRNCFTWASSLHKIGRRSAEKMYPFFATCFLYACCVTTYTTISTRRSIAFVLFKTWHSFVFLQKKTFLVTLRPILNFALGGKLWPQGRSCPQGCILSPGGEVFPWLWNSLLAPPFL
jgi:hypothetical protein